MESVFKTSEIQNQRMMLTLMAIMQGQQLSSQSSSVNHQNNITYNYHGNCSGLIETPSNKARN
jgi:hypothetical protein